MTPGFARSPTVSTALSRQNTCVVGKAGSCQLLLEACGRPHRAHPPARLSCRSRLCATGAALGVEQALRWLTPPAPGPARPRPEGSDPRPTAASGTTPGSGAAPGEGAGRWPAPGGARLPRDLRAMPGAALPLPGASSAEAHGGESSRHKHRAPTRERAARASPGGWEEPPAPSLPANCIYRSPGQASDLCHFSAGVRPANYSAS